MIVSFHPCFEADTNIICAGRDPDARDLAAIRAARAVVLPQGCRESLYRMAIRNCGHVFPDYGARFRYPGKIGQARLFADLAVPHPQTWVFENSGHFQKQAEKVSKLKLPLVFKLDWGGEGDTVALIRSPGDLQRALSKAAAYERSGQSGFILQAYVPDTHRTLRVAVIGKRLQAYWRIQERPQVFGTSVAHGARIDAVSDPASRQAGVDLTTDFCRRTGINLAGFDLIFDVAGASDDPPRPNFLEINYFFGRSGLGGSASFYTMLQEEIENWLAAIDDSTDFHGPTRHDGAV